MKRFLVLLAFAGVAIHATLPAASVTVGGTRIDVADETGILELFTSNGVELLWESAFFYREGSSTELNEMTRSNVVVTSPATDTIRVSGIESTFEFTIDYTIFGDRLTTTLDVRNTTLGTLSLNLFSYWDFDILEFERDAAELLGPNAVRQTYFDGKVDLIFGTTPDAIQGGGPELGDALRDSVITDLIAGAGFPGSNTDFAFAAQWLALLNAGESLRLTSTADAVAPTIPEPGLPLLGAAGLLTLLGCRRRSR